MSTVEYKAPEEDDCLDDERSVVDRVSDAARLLAEEPDLQQTLDRTVEYALNLVDGCDAAGVSLVTGRQKIRTAALTDDLVARGDQMQYELDEGPCLDAIRHAEVVWSPDLASDSRWPRWGPWAVEHLGVRSMLGIQLFTASTTHGALNLYSRTVDGFQPETHPLTTMFATVAVVALRAAQTTEGLQSAIQTRNVIGQAQGIIMERYNVSAVQAFAVLSRVSQESDVKLHVIAAEIATKRVIPGVAAVPGPAVGTRRPGR